MKVDRRKVEIAMARACMSTKDLSEATNMKTTSVCRTFRESNVRPATLGRIAKALGVDVTEIMECEQ